MKKRLRVTALLLALLLALPGVALAEGELLESPSRPDEPVVTAGQHVSKGQLIARPSGMGANIHASIDGTVSAVTEEFIEIRK